MELEHQLRRALTLADAPSSPHARPAGFHTGSCCLPQQHAAPAGANASAALEAELRSVALMSTSRQTFPALPYLEKCACVTGASFASTHPASTLSLPPSLQVWRGALARMHCRRLRAVYAIMGCYKRFKVKAHFWEVERRFANVRNMADYGRSVEWPAPPAALAHFHRATVSLHRR